MVLGAAQVGAWERDGFLVVEDLVEQSACAELMNRAMTIVRESDLEGASVFSTHQQTRTSDEYFLSSGGAIRCFFEEEASDESGTIGRDEELAINKIGHALHDLDPVFDRFSRTPVLAGIAADLGLVRPLLLQSMYIFKQPRIGGEVSCHQDATFLHTEPEGVVGFWFALEDATVANGCLWVEAGGHRGPLRRRFERAGPTDADGTRFVELDRCPLPAPGDSDRLRPLETPAGTLVLLHGLLPHWSGANRSDRSRHAYSVHVIDGRAHYPATNWMQRPPGLPLRGF